MNVAQHYVTITEDKLRLILAGFRETIHARGRAVAPFTTLLTLVLALATSTFKAQGWFILFLLATGGVAVWLLYALVREGSSPEKTIDQVLDEIKGAQLPENVRPFTSSGSPPA